LTTPYDRLAARYAGGCHRRFYARVVEELVGNGDAALRGRGLDLACGVGASTLPLRRAFACISWFGLDRSRPMLSRLRRHAELAGVRAIRAAAETIPIADRSLQLVACSFALHWMQPPALLEMERVLATDGRLFLAAPLRAPAPTLAGNQLLSRALVAERRLLSERPRAGHTVDALQSAFAAWRIHSLRAVTFTEQYPSRRALLASLETRGALAALFGRRAKVVANRLDTGASEQAIGYGWPVALLSASPPPPR
jgi:ubiquinone/menaquinone biosynthesis C-methylase UbiE